MLRFYLKEEPLIMSRGGKTISLFRVRRIDPQPPQTIALFPGVYNHPDYLEPEIIRAIAGDYVEFLNEKYLDKEINQEWPAPSEQEYMLYHIRKAREYAEKIGIDIKDQIKMMDD